MVPRDIVAAPLVDCPADILVIRWLRVVQALL
jgi:hypothetical protein